MPPLLELTDRDFDGLSLYADSEGVWVTCVSGDQEVTAGPFAAEPILAWLVSESRTGVVEA